MKVHKGPFIILTCFFLLFLSSVRDYSQAACPVPVRIAGEVYDFFSIQSAYDYASIDLGLTNFTLLVVGETFEEGIIIDNGAVLIDGGYDCTFSTKNLATGILGSITIRGTGAVTIIDKISVVSPPPCAFDSDGDGHTSIGSCSGTADDCDDNDPNNFPGNPEICDGLDNNCDGQADEGLTAVDADNDGYSAPGSCSSTANDCNDNDPSINPGAIEIYNDGIDQNCDGKDMSNSSDGLCADCHDYATWIYPAHNFDISPDGTCFSCHATAVTSFLDGHYGRTVKTAGNNMPAGATIGCVSCHDIPHETYPGVPVPTVYPKVLAVWPNETCDTCHVNRVEVHTSAHTVALGAGDLSNGVSCGACHAVATWTEIEGTVHNVPTNGDGSCATCHNSARQEVIITIANAANPTNCLDCHSAKALPHGNPDHAALTYVMVAPACASCHTEVGPDATVSITHNSNCFLCHPTGPPDLDPILPLGGGDCTTCHSDTWELTHRTNPPDHS